MEEEKRVFADSRAKLAKLKGFVGILPDKVVNHVPAVFREVYPDDKSKWPVYKIKPVDGIEFTRQLDDENNIEVDWDTKTLTVNKGKYKESLVRRQVKGWDNHTDIDGTVIPYTEEAGQMSEACFRSLQAALIKDLEDAIDSASIVTKEESEGIKS